LLPETGASRNSPPLARTAAAIAWLHPASTVEQSTYALPAGAWHRRVQRARRGSHDAASLG
jgi:hypothetical protein